MILQNNFQYASGLYDFSVSGGAIGPYDLNVPVPTNSALIEFVAWALVNPASGGAATISFDIVEINQKPIVTFVGGLMLATAYTRFAIVSTNDSNVVAGCWLANPLGAGNQSFYTNIPFSIGMSIGGAPLTAGKIAFYVRAISFELGF